MPHSSSLSEQAVLSVNQLNVLAKDILESSFPHVLVEGEISNLAQPSSGHAYFTLKDDKAQIRTALFAGQKSRLKFNLENGQKVLVKGALSLFSARGDYQLIARVIEQSGEGALRREFEQLKNKLESLGWFDEEHKKPLPKFCQHLAVITSPSGAAIRDILHVLKRRYPLMEVTIIPSLVQGKEACRELCAAVEKANQLKQSKKPQFDFDLILLSRGGGSLEDLWPFNEEALAEVIFRSELPIMSGVGHETDFTICDWVADKRAPTPSAAAETVSQDQDNLQYWLQNCLNNLTQGISDSIQNQKKQVLYLSKRNISPKQKLQEQHQRLDFYEQRLNKELSLKISKAKLNLINQTKRLQSTSPKNRLKLLNKEQFSMQKRLHNSFAQYLQQQRFTVSNMGKRLHSLSPLNTLDRGYSITRVQQEGKSKLVQQDTQLKIGEILSTELSHGVIESKVSGFRSK